VGDLEEPRPDPGPSGPEGRGGLSASGWAAVTALGAAAITAAVTLLTHFLPPAGGQQGAQEQVVATSPRAAARTPAPTPAPAPAPQSALLDRLTGTWSGPARSGSVRYTMTLVVTGSCAEGRPCGTMTTDALPCVGAITLVAIEDGPSFDFATGSFTPDSSASCALRPGGGDYFVLGDDVLSYRTGYDGGTSGTLRRVG